MLLRKGTSRPLLYGVVHLAATPRSARVSTGIAPACSRRPSATRAPWSRADSTAWWWENFGDAPFFAERVPPETVATLSLAVARVRSVAGERPVGVNCLRNDARSALGICAATGAAFLRVNVHTGAMVTDQGVIEGRAAETLRERARLCPSARLLGRRSREARLAPWAARPWSRRPPRPSVADGRTA